MNESANSAEPGKFPRDFHKSALNFGWDSLDDDSKLSKRGIKLKKGRAAMMGILGLIVHEKPEEIGMAADLLIIGTLQ